MSLNTKNTVNLKTVAEKVGLAPCSVSAVLNETPASRSIPQATRERIFRAAAELNYRPNFWARSLRTKRTRMVAVVTPDLGRTAVAKVVAAAQDKLHRKGYLLVLESLSSEGPHTVAHLRHRGVEGLIAINAVLPAEIEMPIASVDLEYMEPNDLIGEGLRSWLHDMGAAAADTITREIEAPTPARQIAVEPKLPPAFQPAANRDLRN